MSEGYSFNYGVLWDELEILLRSLPQVPVQLVSRPNYHNFLLATNCEEKFDKAIRSFGHKMNFAGTNLVMNIFNSIAQHLEIVHMEKTCENFMSVAELFQRYTNKQMKWRAKREIEEAADAAAASMSAFYNPESC